MILDKHLTFVKGTDAPAAETRAVCLAQGDLTGTTDGMGPYDGLFLMVTAADTIANLTVTLEHGDAQAGPFTALATYPAKTGLKPGNVVVKAPVPFSAKNWLRVKLSSAAKVNAFLAVGVDKGVVVND